MDETHMLPSNEDFLECFATWRGEHLGILYEIAWHGRSDYTPNGIWNWYILINNQQFYEAEWAKLRLRADDKEMFGSWHRHWNYDDFTDLDAHGGWTFGKLTTYLGRDGNEYEQVKVGCDYAHLWDRESGHLESRYSVERDAKRSIDRLIEMFPVRRERCAYSGRYDDSEQFYTAINGARVHRDNIEKLRESGWDKWMPAEAA